MVHQFGFGKLNYNYHDHFVHTGDLSPEFVKKNWYSHRNYAMDLEDWSFYHTRDFTRRYQWVEQEYAYLQPRYQRLLDKAFAGWVRHLRDADNLKRPISEVYAANIVRKDGSYSGQLVLSSRVYRTRAEAEMEVRRAMSGHIQYARYVGYAVTPQHTLFNDCVYQKPIIAYRVTLWILADPHARGFRTNCEVGTLEFETTASVNQYNFLNDTKYNPKINYGAVDSVYSLLFARFLALYYKDLEGGWYYPMNSSSGYWAYHQGSKHYALNSGTPLNTNLLNKMLDHLAIRYHNEGP